MLPAFGSFLVSDSWPCSVVDANGNRTVLQGLCDTTICVFGIKLTTPILSGSGHGWPTSMAFRRFAKCIHMEGHHSTKLWSFSYDHFSVPGLHGLVLRISWTNLSWETGVAEIKASLRDGPNFAINQWRVGHPFFEHQRSWPKLFLWPPWEFGSGRLGRFLLETGRVVGCFFFEGGSFKPFSGIRLGCPHSLLPFCRSIFIYFWHWSDTAAGIKLFEEEFD